MEKPATRGWEYFSCTRFTADPIPYRLLPCVDCTYCDSAGEGVIPWRRHLLLDRRPFFSSLLKHFTNNRFLMTFYNHDMSAILGYVMTFQCTLNYYIQYLQYGHFLRVATVTVQLPVRQYSRSWLACTVYIHINCTGSCEPGSRCHPNGCQGEGNREFSLQANRDQGGRILSQLGGFQVSREGSERGAKGN